MMQWLRRKLAAWLRPEIEQHRQRLPASKGRK